jgi:hypothetical protein
MCFATAGAALSAGSAVFGGVASSNAARYQAQVASNNATIAKQNAAYSASAGSSQIEQAGLKARAQSSNVKASQAASGIGVNSGSAADVQESQRELGALDTATVGSRAAMAVYGYQSQAQSFTAQSQLDKTQASGDLFGGLLKGAGALAGAAPSTPGGSSLLSGSPSVPSNYSWMQDTTGGGYGGADSALEGLG